MSRTTAARPALLVTLVALVASLGAGGCLGHPGEEPSSTGSTTTTSTTDPVTQVTIDEGATTPSTAGTVRAVYVEYLGMGRWSLLTTCDATVTGVPCPFDLTVSPSDGGTFTAVAGSGLGNGDTLATLADGSIHLTVTTRFGENGCTFTTTPGAEVQLRMLLDGVPQPGYIRALTKGKVQDGVATDPVDFVPAMP